MAHEITLRAGMTRFENRRILVVDDVPSIHLDFGKILTRPAGTPDLGEVEALLFGAVPPPAAIAFEVDSAFQGSEALDKVITSLRAGRPYAMAFIDMRMPPGWNGVETVERLWKEDENLQVVFCTAYSDYSWEDVLARLDVRDRLLILKKPFDPIEVYQLANALTTKWALREQAAVKMAQLEQAVEERTRELSNANVIVQNSPVVLYRLRGEPSFPLIYISQNIAKFGHDPEALVGSSDWARALIHPEDRAKVGNAMARALEKDAMSASIEFRLCTDDGSSRWVENRYVPVRSDDGRLIEIEGIVIDVTERKIAEEKMSLLARTDSLTGLANRATFMERLHQMFASTQRGRSAFAVLYLDLDRFKPVNDTFGHAVGDLLLQEVAKRLRECTGQTDVIARLGGDEFAVIQGDISEAASAAEFASRLQSALARPYFLNDNEINISVSIGICPYAPGIVDSDAMLVQADLALYRSKEDGRNQYHFHSPDLDAVVLDRMTLAAELQRAIEGGELDLEYQPQIELASQAIVGMEALVRWHHPTRGLLEPAAFVPLAERSGSIVPLGRWILDHACGQMHRWKAEGLAPPVVAINLSLIQLKRGQALIHEITAALSKWGLEPADLEFDVTEATLAQLKWTGNEVLPQLRELGVKVAIDDFGSEYSSFDYIKAYRVNHLKIAQSFMRRSTTDPNSAALISAIITFAREIGIGIIAQGVETAEQHAMLRANNAPEAQGFHFSKPVGPDAARELLRGRRRTAR